MLSLLKQGQTCMVHYTMMLEDTKNTILPRTDTNPWVYAGQAGSDLSLGRRGCRGKCASESSTVCLSRPCFWCHQALAIILPHVTLILNIQLLKLEWQEWPPPLAPSPWICRGQGLALKTRACDFMWHFAVVPAYSVQTPACWNMQPLSFASDIPFPLLLLLVCVYHKPQVTFYLFILG